MAASFLKAVLLLPGSFPKYSKLLEALLVLRLRVLLPKHCLPNIVCHMLEISLAVR